MKITKDLLDKLPESKKAELLALLTKKEELENGLPFLYIFGGRIFKWQKEFFESRNRVRLICAANQIGKSTTAIRYALIVATHRDGYEKYNIPSWKELWGDSIGEKITIWYLYPDDETLTIEFKEKWEGGLLPKGDYKYHPVYGWKLEKKQKKPFAIHFNSGASIYFKTYSQDVKHMQATSVHLLIADEEMPFPLYNELSARLFATKGYFIMVFTATLGQEIWRRAMEERGTEKETFKNAFKKTVSMYDCMYYTDGTQRFTEDDIEQVKAICSNNDEVLRRVYGRFVFSKEDLVFYHFDKHRHIIKPVKIDDTYNYYIGIDIGSGGQNHKSAISVVAVNRNFTRAYLVDFWRGENITTLLDVVNKLKTFIKKYSPIVAIYYDYAAKDFYYVAQNQSIGVIKADKHREKGIAMLNTLFQKDMLFIFDYPEMWKLVDELTTLRVETPKKKAKDDGIDSLRYAIVNIPFDFDKPVEKKKVVENEGKIVQDIKRGYRDDDMEEKARQKLYRRIEEEFEEWNEFYEA